MPHQYERSPALEKQAIRERVWEALTAAEAARSARTGSAVPDFVGSERAAALASAMQMWRRARAVFCNSDAAQQPLRKLALQQGKTVYMAIPGLPGLECFVLLEPRRLVKELDLASTAEGALGLGRPVGLEDVQSIDLMVCGSVAVGRRGGRVGPGGGATDLEFAVLTEAGLVSKGTPILTTVHPLQALDEDIPMTRHDVPLDAIVTPEQAIRCRGQAPRPTGVYWDWLPDRTLGAVPVLQRMAPKRAAFTYVGLDPDWDVYRA